MKYLTLVILFVLCSCKQEEDNIPVDNDAAVVDASEAEDIELDTSTMVIFDDTESEVETDEEEIDLPGDLCKPCAVNSDCKAGGGLCITNIARGETFCSISCGASPCPQGFVCVPNVFDLTMSQCMPIDPTIPCKNNYVTQEVLRMYEDTYMEYCR